MPRRKQKSPCKVVDGTEAKKRKTSHSKKVNGPEVAWSKEERERLLQALHEDKGQKNWRAIKKRVGTRDTKQVKDYTKLLKAEQRISAGLVNNVPKNAPPIQVWIDFLEKLKSSSNSSKDMAETVIPQVMTIAAFEPRENSEAVTGPVPNYQKIYTCLGNLLRGQPLPPLFPLDAEVLLSLLNGVEETLLYCDVSEQVRFIRQTFKQQSRDLMEKQLQDLVASLGSTARTSSTNPTSEGDSASTCLKSQSKEDGTKDAASLVSAAGSASTNPTSEGDSASNCLKSQPKGDGPEDTSTPSTSASLGPTAGSASTNPTIEGGSSSNCLKSEPKGDGPEDTGTPLTSVNLLTSQRPTDGASSAVPTSERDNASKCLKSQPKDTGRPPSSFQDTAQGGSEGEVASGSTESPNDKTQAPNVKGPVLRPRKAKVETPEKQENQLLSLNPLKVPVDLLNFYLKTQ